ncbi:hypothetical protein ACS0TY_015864 [Phlomoides rotata]
MASHSPHVVILPFPTQGHIKPMLMLAELLSQAGFTISFVNTDHFHSRLIDEPAFRRCCPGVEFLSIPDGLPSDHPRIGPSFVDLFRSITAASKPVLRSLIMSFANDVAEELGIPAISFRTDSAAATWSYFHFDKLIEEGEMPVLEERGDMDKLVACIPGLKNIVRLYAIGPLHTLLKSTAPSAPLQVDQSCIEWLDSQPPNSVLYVSFGTRAVLSRDELMDEKPFLWVVRPDLIWDVENGSNRVHEEVKMGTVERGRIVGWAPQEDVLAHDAVGGFFTHCGWNSILESICAGKSMICRPMVVEQPLNSRYVSEVWKIGLDVKDICDRAVVEKMSRELMEGDREELMKSTVEIARLAQNSVRDGGSSRADLKKLIEDIKLLDSNKMGFNVDN